MAIVSDNMLTLGLRGKFGKFFVFRTLRGKTVASRAPGKQDKRKETAAQRATRTSFADASRWAKAVLLDPEQKKYYQQRANEWSVPNAYTAAVKDYMRKLNGKAVREEEHHEHALITNNDELCSHTYTSYKVTPALSESLPPGVSLPESGRFAGHPYRASQYTSLNVVNNITPLGLCRGFPFRGRGVRRRLIRFEDEACLQRQGLTIIDLRSNESSDFRPGL